MSPYSPVYFVLYLGLSVYLLFVPIIGHILVASRNRFMYILVLGSVPEFVDRI